VACTSTGAATVNLPRSFPVTTDEPPTQMSVSAQRWEEGLLGQSNEKVATETALALHYNHRPHMVVMLTPQDIEEFVLGFSLSEGILHSPDELQGVRMRTLADGLECDAAIALERYAELDAHQRRLASRSGCGVCGAETLGQAVRSLPPVAATVRMTHAALQAAMGELAQRQPLNAATGAVHAAAWVDTDGNICLVREDVGRHNALDKLIGALSRAGLHTDRGALLLTSRASHEMVQKAAALGMQIVCAISAPTSLAIRQAQQTHVTLVGFARGARHTIYTHPHRLT
jgi:FdhD protein